MKFNDINHFAYMCPSCFGLCGCSFNIFVLANKQPYRFLCADHRCSAKCAELRKINRDKYELKAECPYCGETHKKVLSFSELWNTECSYVTCPVFGMKVFFYGSSIKKINAALSDAVTDAENTAESIGDHPVTDNDPILSEILMILERRFQDHSVACICGSQDISFDHIDGSIVLTCRRWGRKKSFSVSKDNLLRLINASEVILGS